MVVCFWMKLPDGGRTLNNDMTLRQCGIKDESAVLQLQLLGSNQWSHVVLERTALHHHAEVSHCERQEKRAQRLTFFRKEKSMVMKKHDNVRGEVRVNFLALFASKPHSFMRGALKLSGIVRAKVRLNIAISMLFLLLIFWVRRPPGRVGVFHAKGWWPKSLCPPSKVCLPWALKRGIWVIPKILPGCPGLLGGVQKARAKKFVLMFRSLTVSDRIEI